MAQRLLLDIYWWHQDDFLISTDDMKLLDINWWHQDDFLISIDDTKTSSWYLLMTWRLLDIYWSAGFGEIQDCTSIAPSILIRPSSVWYVLVS